MINGKSPISAVIFDRDGVLTDYDMMAAALHFRELLPISLEEMWVRWETLGQKLGYPSSIDEENEYFRHYWDMLADEFALDDKMRHRLHQYKYADHMVAYSEVIPALVSVRNMECKVGVLSNFALASLGPSLEATGLRPLVDVACAATVIGASKPDRRAYEIAAQALGVEPCECLFFDDEAPCVKGARDAGMTAYLVDRSYDTHSLGEYIVCDLSAVGEIVKKRQGR